MNSIIKYPFQIPGRTDNRNIVRQGEKRKSFKETEGMEKKIFEPAEITLQKVADVIVTSNYNGMNGEYDLTGNWIEFGAEE